MTEQCVSGCCARKVNVREEGDTWVIDNHPGWKELRDFTQPEPGTTDIMITPGVNPDNPADIRPVKIVLPKTYGGVHEVISEIIPAIISKERDCTICAKVKEILLGNVGDSK